MNLINVQCKACGGVMQVDSESDSCFCGNCGQQIYLNNSFERGYQFQQGVMQAMYEKELQEEQEEMWEEAEDKFDSKIKLLGGIYRIPCMVLFMVLSLPILSDLKDGVNIFMIPAAIFAVQVILGFVATKKIQFHIPMIVICVLAAISYVICFQNSFKQEAGIIYCIIVIGFEALMIVSLILLNVFLRNRNYYIERAYNKILNEVY